MSDKFDSDKAFEKVLATSLEAELMPAGRDCPHPGTLSAYYERTLTESEARDCERHTSTCAACQQQLALLARLEPGGAVSDAAPEVEVPETAESRLWSWKWTAPAALAATAVLAILVTYRSRPIIEEASRLAAGSAKLSQTADVAPPPPTPAATAAEAKEPEAHDEQALGRAASSEPIVMPTSEPTAGRELLADRAAAPPPEDFASRPEAEKRAMEAPATEAPSAEAPTAVPAVPAPAAAAPSQPRLAAKVAPAVEASAARKVERAERDKTSGAPAGAPAPPSRAESASAGVTLVARSNPQVVWRLGGGGRIERSDDSGETWQPQASGVAVGLAAGSAPSEDVCWVVGKGGTVLRTSDGHHWEKASSPTGEDLVRVTAWGATQATVTSSSGQRFGTDDGGRTWSPR